jgi:penicillin-binding protein 1A
MNGKPKRRVNAKTSGFTMFIKTIKFLFIALVVATLVGGLYAAKISLAIAEDAPELNAAKFIHQNQPSVVLDSTGAQYDIVHTDEVRFPVSLEEMGQTLQNAFISIEDERFYKHNGVDYRRTISVVIQDVVGRVTGNRSMQGGSTLTQQIIKNTFLTRDKEYTRKIKEIFMALEAEKVLSKEQILETYMNGIFLGGKANGVEAAARQYFSKNAKDLTLIEAAYIAGTTQSPSVYYAFSDSSKANPAKYINRTKLVLQAMLKNEKITQVEYDTAIVELDATGITFNQTILITDKYNYEYFTRPVIDQVRADLKEKNGLTDEEITELLSYGGLTIHSTMNRVAQDYAQSILNDFNNIKSEYNQPKLREATAADPESKVKTLEDGSRWVEYTEVTEAQAAFSAVDYKTGQVQVIIGGRNQESAAGYNRAYYSPTFSNSVLRSIGSTTKPLTVYGPGIDTGKITLGSLANDTKIEYALFKPLGFTTSPLNVNNRYTGMTDIRTAIVNSYNTVSVRTYSVVGKQTSQSYGEKFGLVYSTDNSAVGASTLALGSNYEDGKDGGNPLVLATAYGAFGNSGIVTESILYTKVTDASGNVILENVPESKQVIKPQTAYILYDVMKDVVRKNVPSAKLTSMPIAGKTGTSQGRIDTWFAGLSPYYYASMWIGSDTHEELHKAGSQPVQTSYATQVAFGKIMKFLHEGLPVKDIKRPGGIVQGSFCTESGAIPNDYCIEAGTARTDLFIDGTQPTELCTIHIPPVEPEPIPVDPTDPLAPVVVPPAGINNNNKPGNP